MNTEQIIKTLMEELRERRHDLADKEIELYVARGAHSAASILAHAKSEGFEEAFQMIKKHLEN